MCAQPSVVFHVRRVDGNVRTIDLRPSDSATTVRRVSGCSREPVLQGTRGMRAQAGNWLTATFVVGFLILLATILGSLAGQRSADPFLRRPSTFFTDPSGARALLLVMNQLLPSAEQWRCPLNLLESPTDQSAPSTLVVAGGRGARTHPETEEN